jgi:pentatricopeptide repeat protein
MKDDPDSQVFPNNVTYNSLLDCCVRCFDMGTASKIFDEMQSGGCPKGDHRKSEDSQFFVKPDLISYSTMIKGFCKEKNIEQAFVMLEVMDKSNIKADEVLYNSLLDGCCKAGEVDMALKVYSNMRALNIRPSNVTFSILVKVHSRRNDLKTALEVL